MLRLSPVGRVVPQDGAARALAGHADLWRRREGISDLAPTGSA